MTVSNRKAIVLELPDGRRVYETSIPGFLVMPDVIVWGSRVFVANFMSGNERERRGITDWKDYYREAFAYHLPDST